MFKGNDLSKYVMNFSRVLWTLLFHFMHCNSILLTLVHVTLTRSHCYISSHDFHKGVLGRWFTHKWKMDYNLLGTSRMHCNVCLYMAQN